MRGGEQRGSIVWTVAGDAKPEVFRSGPTLLQSMVKGATRDVRKGRMGRHEKWQANSETRVRKRRDSSNREAGRIRDRTYGKEHLCWFFVAICEFGKREGGLFVLVKEAGEISNKKPYDRWQPIQRTG